MGLCFNQRKAYFVIVTLSDGTKLAGEYAEGSFTSSYPEDPQIYLIKTWVVNEVMADLNVNENSLKEF